MILVPETELRGPACRAQSIQLVNDLAGRGLYEVDVIVGIDIAISAHVRTPIGRNGTQLNVSGQARPDRNSLARRIRCNAFAGNVFADMGALLRLKADTGSPGTCLNAHGLRQSRRCKRRKAIVVKSVRFIDVFSSIG